MDEVRCPMCGKANPADLEVCQYCQARLKPLVISPTPEEPSKPSPTPTGDKPQPPKKRPVEATPSKPDFLGPDWLQSLRQDGESQDLSGSEEDLPMWHDLEAESSGEDLWESDESAEPEEATESESVQEEAEEETQAVTPPFLEEAEATDWLDSLRPRSHLERESQGEQVPEWLTQAEPVQENLPEEVVPEWLHKIRERQKAEEPQTPPAVPDAGAIEFLTGLRSISETEEERPTEPVSQEVIESRLDQDMEIPDWLSDKAGAAEEVELPELPDWLETEEVSAESPAGIAGEGSKSPAAKQPAPPALAGEEETPDWLGMLEKKASLDEAQLLPEDEEARPDWLKELQSSAAPVSEEPSRTEEELRVVAPFTLDEESDEDVEGTPEWMKAVSPPPAPPASVAVPKEGEEITPAELPTWLEAMRPVEAAAPSIPILDERERSIETSGPLAGLRGILPAEPEVARQKKSQTYSVKLQISEKQQSHAAQLSEMVKSEGISRPLPRPPVIPHQLIQRVVIFVLLLVSISWPIFTGEIGTPMPEISGEILDARNIANSIPDGGNVLIAVDYQPGFSGELEAAAMPLIDHLMIKGAYLSLVSTNTTGPAQAERLVRGINTQMGHHYQDINQYANLGYIAGGLAGLRGFVDAPRNVTPFALNDDPNWNDVWTAGRLSGVQKLSDYALIVVISENPDAARAWIEQAGPTLDATPILMVVSAQADPMVRPYYESSPRQIEGLISGLAGGTAYASLMPRAGQLRTFWDAFSFGMPVAVLILLLGGLLSVIGEYLPALRRGKGEA